MLARVQVQRKHMEAAQNLRGLTSNQDVIRNAEAQIREAQRNISYLEESLRSLQGRRSSGVPSSASSGAPGSASGADGSSWTGASTASFGSLSAPGARQFPGDSSSSYLGSSAGSARYEERPAPPPKHGAEPGYGPPGSAGYAPQGSADWRPAPIGRMGTSARKQYTNLGEQRVRRAVLSPR